MNQFGSGKLTNLAMTLLGGGSPAPAPAPMQQFGRPQPTPMQQMQHGRVVDPMASQGDGMADGTPAQIDGEHPAALASGEFVVPADAVSGLGNGSSAAGAKVLDDMVGRTRKMRTGGITQAPQIDPNAVLPA